MNCDALQTWHDGDVLGGQQQIMQVHCADANTVVQQVESRSGGSMGAWSGIIKSKSRLCEVSVGLHTYSTYTDDSWVKRHRLACPPTPHGLRFGPHTVG